MTTTPAATLAGEQRVLSTLNIDGSRRWLRPRVSPGRFLTARRAVAWALILVFTVTPFVEFGGEPLVQVDLAARHLHFFGMTFLPTDTVLLALLLVGTFVTIFLLTALFGRVWCGWACPQTVYMEFVFRPIERLFDGAPGRLTRPRLAGTAAGSVLKYAAFLMVSMYIAHTFLAWFVGVETLWTWIRSSPAEHPGGFLVMLTVTGLMMFDFCYFREQTCIVACPYGRFQSALLDRGSLIISYDRTRGEPRGKARKKPERDVSLPVVGDCVDCGMCVTTCPTGIDIRNGLQMECVGCAQCIDACDSVMDRLGRARGLIRYSTPAAIEGAPRPRFRPRLLLYPLVLVAILSAFVVFTARRGPADVTVLRGLGQPFTLTPEGMVTNPLRIKFVNRTREPARYLIALEGAPGASIVAETNPVEVAAGKSITAPVTVAVSTSAFSGGKATVTVRISDGRGWETSTPYRLMGPVHAAPATGGSR